MSLHRTFLAPACAAIVPLALLDLGCSKKGMIHPLPNIRPVIELTRAPYNQSTRFEYSYRMDWLGYDPDGRVDYYLYTIDPPSPTAANPNPDSVWVRTMRSEQLINFTASKPDSSEPGVHGSSDFHTFVVKAVDNGGLQSAPLYRSFFTFTVAPTVTIQSPAPSDRSRSYVTPAVRISWSGTDDDGIFDSKKPVKYKYIMLTPNSPLPFSVALSTPDSVRRYYAPRNWAGWDSTTADTTEVQFTNLTPLADYMFVVVAFDEAGAYSPVFSLNGNMLNMRVTYAAVGGPLLTIFNEIFTYTYTSGVISLLPQYQIPLEVPASQPIDFNWSGVAGQGASVLGYRWALDISDISDETPRNPPATDFKHWSAEALGNSFAQVGPFGGGENHLFYIEASDNNGLKSLGIVNMTTVQATLTRPLLVVKDLRMVPDYGGAPGGCTLPPKTAGPWPDAAELDTFLFARGGKPWQCYPTGTFTTPGLFAGYPVDTIGTRVGRSEVRVPLAVLGQYAHVVWVTDDVASRKDKPGTSIADGLCALNYMTAPGRANTLAAYVKQGGYLWLTGGGVAYASLINYNKTANDVSAKIFSNNPAYSELIPGRMMYDFAHWQSEITIGSPVNVVIKKNLGRFDAPGGAIPAAYAALPGQMRYKSPAFDPVPPYREVAPNNFYRPSSSYAVEYLSQPNFVQEDLDPSPLVENTQSTLDSLYSATASSGLPFGPGVDNVCMTLYHGLQTIQPVVFTGFNMWSYTRPDCQQLVDAIVGTFWGIPKASTPMVSSRMQRVVAAAPPAWSPPGATSGAVPRGAMVIGRKGGGR